MPIEGSKKWKVRRATAKLCGYGHISLPGDRLPCQIDRIPSSELLLSAPLCLGLGLEVLPDTAAKWRSIDRGPVRGRREGRAKCF